MAKHGKKGKKKDKEEEEERTAPATEQNQETSPEEAESAAETESDDPGYFRYTDRPGKPAKVVPIKDTEKYKKAKAVYDQLVEAKGDFRYPIPSFVMSRGERMVAWMNYEKLQIGLEEKAYEVCQNFGGKEDAAIATLLGHELTHYYEKHAWRRGFAANFRDLDIGLKLGKVEDNVVNETQADYLGGFLAYSAGFDVFDQTPEFMSQVYQAYGFPEELGDNYPSLSDRKVLAARSAERMKKLIDIFNMANWLIAGGAYEEAELMYRYILREYQSRELYNNRGVVYVLAALKKFTKEELKFLLPLELDLASIRSSSRDIDTERLEFLQGAILQFDYSINLSPDYAPAYLNKACAYMLLGDLARAKFYAETEAMNRAVDAKQTKVIADIEVLLGIIAAKQEDDDLAVAYFDKAKAKNNSLGDINKDILQGKPVPVANREKFSEETIDGVNLSVFLENPEYSEDLSLAITNSISLLKNPKPSPDCHSSINMHYNAARSLIICIHMTDPEYPGETAKGIKLGASEADIADQYGEPIRRLATPQGIILTYTNLLFFITAKKGLVRWANYLKQELG